MIITQLTAKELQKVQDLKDSFLIVESQVYGQISDFRYNVVSSKNLIEEFEKRGIGRTIQDTGRTPGFWQNLAGKGIYCSSRPSLIDFQNYPVNVSKILKKCKEAMLTITGKTWSQILSDCPFNTEFKTILGLNEKTITKASPKRKTAKSKSAK